MEAELTEQNFYGYIAVASVLVTTLAFFFWYRVLTWQARALAATVLTALVVAPILTFMTLEHRLGFSWDDFDEHPAGGIPIMIGVFETFGIWVASVAIATLAHFFVADRYVRFFRKADDEKDVFE